MSWIFHEPLDIGLYHRRLPAPPQPAGRAFSPAARMLAGLLAAGVWDEAFPAIRPPRRPIRGQGRAFSPGRLTASLIAGDLFVEDVWTGQRRAWAPVHVVTGTGRAFSPAARVLASLLAAGVWDEAFPAIRPPRPTPIAVAPGDMGRSASFTVVFAGKGDDPYGAVGVAAGACQGLGADPCRELAVQDGAVFSGSSASRIV